MRYGQRMTRDDATWTRRDDQVAPMSVLAIRWIDQSMRTLEDNKHRLDENIRNQPTNDQSQSIRHDRAFDSASFIIEMGKVDSCSCSGTNRGTGTGDADVKNVTDKDNKLGNGNCRGYAYRLSRRCKTQKGSESAWVET